jgi:hypothetical protein
MPSYQLPFAAGGALLGGAGGAAAGGLLGQAGSVLGTVGDYLQAPRKLAWGALGLPDTGTGVLQKYAGMDPDSVWTKALGTGLEVAGDPLTYLGAGLGAVPGWFGGRALGEGLETAALARGPQYAGGVEKLAAMAPQFAAKGEAGTTLFDALMAHPQIGRALEEMPQGSKLLAHGVEGAVFDTGQGDVVRLGTAVNQPPGENLVPLPKPRGIPGVLEPTRDVALPQANWEEGGLRVERLPRAAGGYGASGAMKLSDIAAGLADKQSRFSQGYDLAKAFQEGIGVHPSGWEFTDAHPGNVMDFNTPEGQVQRVIDGMTRAAGYGPAAEPGLVPGQIPGWKNWLLDRLGATGTVRNELAARAAAPYLG